MALDGLDPMRPWEDRRRHVGLDCVVQIVLGGVTVVQAGRASPRLGRPAARARGDDPVAGPSIGTGVSSRRSGAAAGAFRQFAGSSGGIFGFALDVDGSRE